MTQAITVLNRLLLGVLILLVLAIVIARLTLSSLVRSVLSIFGP